MPAPRPVPEPLLAEKFFTAARAQELGAPRSVLNHLEQPHRGVFGVAMPTSVLEDAIALSCVLPRGCVYSHLTAAWLLRLPVPWRWTPHPRPPLDVLRRDGTPPRRRTVRGHRCAAPELPTVRVPGLSVPVVHPTVVFRQLATRLEPRDLVTLGDMVLSWRSGLEKSDLVASLEVRGPGIRAARQAAAEVRAGVASAMESLMRQDFELAGLPRPELNAEILDEAGRSAGFVDFLWRRERVVVEYNGAYHYQTAEQRAADEARRNRLERLGYRVIVVNRIDYYRHHAEVIASIRAALGLAA